MGAAIAMAITTATSFTPWDNVWSCIEVIACTNDTASPTPAATTTIGNDTSRQRIMAWVENPISVFKSISRVRRSVALPVSHDESMNQRRPAVHRDKQQQLERDSDAARLNLAQPHCQQYIGNNQVHDDKRDIEQEADLEGVGQLGQRECRREHHEVGFLQLVRLLLGPDRRGGAQEEALF